MKWILYLVAAIVAAIVAMGWVLSLASREGDAPGLLNGRLKPCPETPNCVCSECSQELAYVPPLECGSDLDASWEQAQMVVIAQGGAVTRVEDGYLAATFRTPLFRFVDDLEMRLDRDSRVIHIRSASRVGRSDLGTNRKRVEAIRSRCKVPVTR